jgi:type I restriction enzyme, R subunit
LKTFQDNEKTIPTILTTSQKLSTGVDARNIRNIVLMRPVNSIIEFKQIVGRGTRLFEGKNFFTIYDFVDAYKNFNDPEWDGEPLEPVEESPKKIKDKIEEKEEKEEKLKKKILKIKLRDGKEKEIQHMITTSLYIDGKSVTLKEFINKIYGDLPKLFKSEEDLRLQWSSPNTRRALLLKMGKEGYGMEELTELQKVIGAEKSDLFDVLEYLYSSFSKKPITREKRVALAQHEIFNRLDDKQKEFLEFVLSKYIENGFEELDDRRITALLKIRYNEVNDAIEIIGGVKKIRETFIESQKELYAVA